MALKKKRQKQVEQAAVQQECTAQAPTLPPQTPEPADQGVTPLDDAEVERALSELTWDRDYVRVRFVEPATSPDDTTVSQLIYDSTKVQIEVDEDRMVAVLRSLDGDNPCSVRGRIDHVLKGRKRA